MDSHSECRPGRRRRRHHLTGAALAAALLVALLPSMGTASAAPPLCEDGSPPPCDLPPPDPDPDPDPNPNPNPSWTSLVSVLDQSEAGYDPQVRGAWVSTGSPVYTTPSGTVQWNSPAHNQGSISLTSTYLPPGPLAGFHLWEQDQDINGSLCRSTPVPSIAQVLETTHVLVADTETTTPADLALMADEFEGDASIPESESGTYSADIQLNEVTIAPGAGALALTVKGHLFVDGPGPFNVEGDFRYTGEVHLMPSEKSDMAPAVPGGAPVLQMVSTTVSNDALVIFGEDSDVEADLLPPFRRAVINKVTDAVNKRVAQNEKVKWFATLGFTVSFRDVSIDEGGIHVLPSLCKVG